MIELRKAETRDIDAVNAVVLAAKAHWGYSEELMRAFSAELHYEAPVLVRDATISLVAATTVDDPKNTSRVVGFCRIVPKGDGVGELDALFVHPDWIGTGTGRRLIVATCRLAADWPLTRLEIQSDPYAEGFYLALGAVRIGTRESGSIRGRELPLLALDVVEMLDRFETGV